MKKLINSRLEILTEDITKLEVDAVVNAANNSLVGGGGVDGFPKKQAADIAYEEIKNFLEADTLPEKVILAISQEVIWIPLSNLSRPEYRVS
jgi:O-acetyl-ADP-ribose deacetylase (regulator of RNase III)